MTNRNRSRWIRVAGNSVNIKSGHPHGWRFYFRDEPSAGEFPLRHWVCRGKVTDRNFVPGVNPTGDERKLIAWIDLYGDVEVGNDVLSVTLQDPA